MDALSTFALILATREMEKTLYSVVGCLTDVQLAAMSDFCVTFFTLSSSSPSFSHLNGFQEDREEEEEEEEEEEVRKNRQLALTKNLLQLLFLLQRKSKARGKES
jgi:hypothetical protein